MMTTKASTNIVRNSNSPMVNTVERGRSTIHCGSESVAIVLPPAWLIKHVRYIASVPRVTMIEGIRHRDERTVDQAQQGTDPDGESDGDRDRRPEVVAEQVAVR